VTFERLDLAIAVPVWSRPKLASLRQQDRYVCPWGACPNLAVDSVDISSRIFSAPDTSFRESQFCRIIGVRALNHCISISAASSY
jgi:hypothetical protein